MLAVLRSSISPTGMRYAVQWTRLLDQLKILGLQRASYIDFLQSREHDREFWLGACSASGSSSTWYEAEAGSNTRLDAHPRQPLGKFTSPREKLQSNPSEVLYYSTGRSGRVESSVDVQHWSDAEGLSHLLIDGDDHVYVMRLLDVERQPFLFEAALAHSELLYASTSPFLPIYDTINYGKENLGFVVTQCPPFPLGCRLLPDSGQDEVRRVLERARDLFSHLVALKAHGVSLDGQRPSDEWSDAFLTGKPYGPFLVPAYLEPSYQKSSKLTRLGHSIEDLPAPPEDAWPLAPLMGRGGVAGLPWSQVSAYNDPRVPGPKL